MLHPFIMTNHKNICKISIFVLGVMSLVLAAVGAAALIFAGIVTGLRFIASCCAGIASIYAQCPPVVQLAIQFLALLALACLVSCATVKMVAWSIRYSRAQLRGVGYVK